MRTPLLLPLSCTASGLCCAVLLDLRVPPWGCAALLLCLVCAALARHPFPFLLGVAAFFFAWGGGSLQHLLQRDSAWLLHTNEAEIVEGVLASRPEGRSGATRLYLEELRLLHGAEAAPLTGRLLVYVGGGKVQLKSGDRVRLATRIRLPRRYGLPGEGDYPRYLALKGVQGVGFVPDAQEVVLVSSGRGWRGALDRVAARLGGFIDETVPGAEGAILKALLLGDGSGLPQDVHDAYARGGVSHILSISGFHVGIIYLCLFQLLFLLGRCSESAALACNLKRVLLLAAFPVTVLYLFISGCAPATLRSVLMIASLTLALFLKRETEPLNVIMLAACAILAAAPEDLFDVSFQLSFLAVWGLAVVLPLMMPDDTRVKGVWRWLLLTLCASAAAIVATAVPAAYHFHGIPLAGLLCNLLVIPLMGYGAVLLGFASLVSSLFVTYPAQLLMLCAAQLVRLSDRVILLFARIPPLEYQPDRLDFTLALLALCTLTFVKGARWRLAGSLLLCGALVWRAVPHDAPDGRLHVLFLSVGQGDAALLRLPDGKTMLVDGGGSFGQGDQRVGERLLIPALLALKVRRIDYLVLSHPHPDHQQGLLAVAARWEVGEFWETGLPCDDPQYRQLKWVLASRGVPTRTLRGGMDPFAAGGARMEPLWPPLAAREGTREGNDDSLVLRVRCGRGSVLLTGDVGRGAELFLVRSGAALESTLLKVPHHGSSRSSCDPFLAACAPREAVISAGHGNRFRLPAAATLKRLARHGIRVHRTDLEGSVQAVVGPDGSCRVSTPWEGAF